MRLLQHLEVEEKDIIYPSPENPRLRGLSPDEPSVKALAENIRKEGQHNPIMVAQEGDKYETVDGDRRCEAIFKVLKWKTIKADLYDMTRSEKVKARLTANIMHEDLSTLEKGRYCRDLFDVLCEEGGLVGSEVWGSVQARSKILAQICNDLNVNTSTVLNWIRLWEQYPREAQDFIARNKEDLRSGMVCPSVATQVLSLSKCIGASPEAVLKIAGNTRVTLAELSIIYTRAREIGDISLEDLEQQINDQRKELVIKTVRIYKKNYRALARLCENRMPIMEGINLAIELVLTDSEFLARLQSRGASGE